MSVSIEHVDLTGLDRSIRELAVATGKSFQAEGRAQMRLLIRDAINLTPPGGGGVTGIAAKKRGEAAILGDLFGGREISMGGFRVKTDGLFIVSNADPNAYNDYVAEFRSQNNKPTFRKKEPGEEEIQRLYTNKKGQVYGVEKTLFRPNASLAEMLKHIARFRNPTTGRVRVGGLRDKVIGRHTFIDKMVISSAAKKTLLKHLYGNVGHLMANWGPAAKLTGATMPKWAARHGSHGSAKISSPNSPDFVFEATNLVEFGRAGKDMRRRLKDAIFLRIQATKRRIPKIMIANAKKAGFG